MKPDPCPAHIEPAEWRGFLKLLADAKARAAATWDRYNAERLKRK